MIVKVIVILILLIIFCLMLIEVGIISAITNMIVLLTLIWIVSQVEKLKNRNREVKNENDRTLNYEVLKIEKLKLTIEFNSEG